MFTGIPSDPISDLKTIFLALKLIVYVNMVIVTSLIIIGLGLGLVYIWCLLDKDSIGIAYVGGMDKHMEEWIDTRTDEQKDSLFNLLMDLKFEFPNAIVYGHNDFTDKKVCPCFDAKKEYSEKIAYG